MHHNRKLHPEWQDAGHCCSTWNRNVKGWKENVANYFSYLVFLTAQTNLSLINILAYKKGRFQGLCWIYLILCNSASCIHHFNFLCRWVEYFLPRVWLLQKGTDLTCCRISVLWWKNDARDLNGSWAFLDFGSLLWNRSINRLMGL